MTRRKSSRKSPTSRLTNGRAESSRWNGPTRRWVTLVTLIAVGIIGGYALWVKAPHTAPNPSTAGPESIPADPSDKPASRNVAPVAEMSRIVTERDKEQAEEIERLLDPTNDGWDTERFSDLAARQLRHLAELLEIPTAAQPASLVELISTSFRCETLRPDTQPVRISDSRIRVERATASDTNEPHEFAAAEGFATALHQLAASVGADGRHAHLKIIRVVPLADGFDTHVQVELEGQSDRTRHQVTATWACRWSVSENHLLPRLMTIQVLRHELVSVDLHQSPWFTDATSALLANVQLPRDEISLGMDHWVNRLDRRLMISRFGHHGVAIADVNSDGRDDVYICQPGGLPNRLLLQQTDGTLTDVSASAGVDCLDSTTSALLADLDNDGDQDLVLATIAALVVCSNRGDGTFQPRVALPECDRGFSLSAADVDQDGWLDLYVCRYRPDATYDFELPLPVPYHDANNGGRNVLLRNLGTWQFEDVTDQIGLDQNNSRFSFAAAWEDYDNDGDQDLYVANDYGRNNLYRNDEGTFADVAASARVEDIASGMSVTWSDYNHDGHVDVYVSNMFSSAGNRIAFHPTFAVDVDATTRSQLQRHARGNTLFVNRAGTSDDGPHFDDVSDTEHVTLGRWAWGSLFADINNDGWDDLLVANGLISTEDQGDL